jgi:hypothetical protein
LRRRIPTKPPLCSQPRSSRESHSQLKTQMNHPMELFTNILRYCDFAVRTGTIAKPSTNELWAVSLCLMWHYLWWKPVWQSPICVFCVYWFYTNHSKFLSHCEKPSRIFAFMKYFVCHHLILFLLPSTLNHFPCIHQTRNLASPPVITPRA